MEAALYPVARPAAAPPAVRPAPLVVELESLLGGSDLLIESLAVLAKRRPLSLCLVPAWLFKGRAHLGHRLAREVMPDVSTLPYRPDVLAYLEAERRRGTPLVLVARADERVAHAVAAHLGLFERVLASDAQTELFGPTRRDLLVAEFGERGFDYAARDRDDPVWAAARDALVVRDRRRQPDHAATGTGLLPAFETAPAGAAVHLRTIRPHHWLKNALLFVPLIAAGRLFEPALLGAAVLAFVAFGLCASSAYLLNDLLDLPSDRRHPRKRDRPLASGRLPTAHAAALIPLLVAGAVAVALLLPPWFLAALAAYYALTLTYSLRLRDLALVDAVALAGLYTVRVVAGATAVGVAAPAWLLVFSVGLFFSLAMVKRYAELATLSPQPDGQARVRGYVAADRGRLAALGAASGGLAVMVLAFSIDPGAAGGLAMRGWRASLVGPLLLCWVGYMWLMAHRARMPDDPLVFALRDRFSLTLIASMSAIALIPS